MSRHFRILALIGCLLAVTVDGLAQLSVADPYLVVNAGPGDPLFTTYAGAIGRSRFFADKADFNWTGFRKRNRSGEKASESDRATKFLLSTFFAPTKKVDGKK